MNYRIKPLYGIAILLAFFAGACLLIGFASRNVGSIAQSVGGGHRQAANVSGIGSGLVGWWTMDTADINWGGNSIADASGSGNTGSLSGISSGASVTGVINQALTFDGSSSHISAGNSSIPNNSNTISVSAWVNIGSNPSNTGTIVARTNANSTNGNAVHDFILDLEGPNHNDPVFHGPCSIGSSDPTDAANQCKVDSGMTLTPGQWYYVVGTVASDNTLDIYVNGGGNNNTPTATAQGIGTFEGFGMQSDNSLPVYIGAAEGIGNYFKGKIDDVRIYNRTLAGTEVSQLYSQGQGGVVSQGSSDVTPPTVSIISPSGGAVLSGNVTLAANAADDEAVAGVQFKADGTNIGSEVPSSPYTISWNTTQIADGSHALTATARDGSGNRTTSATVNVTVSNQGSKTVKQDGSGDYRTISACAAAALPGTTCVIYSGTYNETLHPSVPGTYTNPINFEAASGATVNIDAINLDNPRTGGDAWYDNASIDNIWIDGLNFKAITQYGITFHFDTYYPTGEFANGDYWVRGPVTITAMDPAFNNAHNGWEVNPVVEDRQPYDAGADGTNAQSQVAFLVTEPSLPYVANPSSGTVSIIKSLSIHQSPSITPYCHTDVPSNDPDYTGDVTIPNDFCLKSASVLTVLSAAPPGDGKAVFRPPYEGATKPPYYTIAQLQTNLLPSYAPVANTPALSVEFERMRRVQMEHLQNPACEVPPYLDEMTYGPFIGRNNNEAMLRLMLNDPLSDKMPLLIAVVQGGIDRYQSAKDGQTWNTGCATWAGEKSSIAFAGVLLGDSAIQDFVDWDKNHNFIDGEDPSLQIVSHAGMTLWDAPPPYPDTSQYWAGQASGIADNLLGETSGDPYDFIDSSGTYSLADAYQIDFTGGGPWKSSAAVATLLPQIKQIWDNPKFFNYVERWHTTGVLTQPDMCAPLVGICQGGTNAGATCTSQTETVRTQAQADALGDSNSAGIVVGGNTACGGGGMCKFSGINNAQGVDVFTANYGVTYGDDPHNPGMCIPDPNLVQSPPPTPTNFTCQTGKLCGRYPLRQGSFANDDGSVPSAFTDSMWTAYIDGAMTHYSLSYTAGAHGTIAGTASQSVSSGGNGSAVTAIPDSGYNFVSWSDNSTANPRTDTNVQHNLSVTASFSGSAPPVSPAAPPAVTSVSSSVTSSSVTITWHTDVSSNSLIQYGVAGYTSSSGILDAGGATSHSITISGLDSNTAYNYEVTSANIADLTQSTVSASHTFTTSASVGSPPPPVQNLGPTVDTTPPTLSSVSTSVTTTSATFAWNTNEAADSLILYGVADYSSSSGVQDSGGAIHHSITVTNLSPGTFYIFEAVSKDLAGNQATSTPSTFTTLAAPSSASPSAPVTTYVPTSGGGGGGGGGSSPVVPVVAPVLIAGCPAGSTCTKAPAAPSVTLAPISTLLYPGLSGDGVKTLQLFLVSQGYMPAANVTSYYGSLTQGAVAAFQQKNGIVSGGSPDTTGLGLVGSKTKAAIDAIIAKTPAAAGNTPVSAVPGCPAGLVCTPSAPTKATPTAVLTVAGAITKYLYLGLTDAEVRTLQQDLNGKGYTVALSGNGSSGHESTYFGPATQSALQKFQCIVLSVCSGTPASTGYGATGPKTRAAVGK